MHHIFIGVVWWMSPPVWAFEESVRRESVDAGVHIPVLTRAPTLVHSVEAAFPEKAKADGKSATVKMIITVEADGSVSDVQIPQPVGFGFDEAAKDALMQFVFTPAWVDDKPAPIQLEYAYHFEWKAPPPSEKPELSKRVARLKGTLVSRGSRTRVAFGHVRCESDQQAWETTSDGQGRFDLEIHAGTCAISVVAPDYEVFHTLEKLKPQETLESTYYLVPTATGFETVVRGKQDKKEVVRRTVERQELQKIPGSFGDPVRVLQNFPGVARAPFVSGALIVRGASANQTLTFLDGVEIPLLFHLGAGPSVINGEFLDQIEFYPGGFGARYGRAVGGVVDVTTRKGASDTWHGVAKVDLQDSSVFFETPLGKEVSLAVAARRSYIDAIIPWVLPQDPEGGTLQLLPVYADYQVRLDVGRKGKGTEKKGHSNFYLMAFGSDDTLKVVATGGGRNRNLSVDVHTLFHRLVGRWTYTTPSATVSLTPYVGFDKGGVSFGSTTAGGDQYAFGFRKDLTVQVEPWWIFRAGADVKFERIVATAELPVLNVQYVPFPGAEPKVETQKLNRLLSAFDGALYMESDFKWGRWTLSPGLRASSAVVYRQNRWATEPRLWTRFRLTEKLSLKGSMGLYTQPPQPQDLEPAPLGNQNLKHERAFQSALGFLHQFSDVLSLDVTGYYNRRFENVGAPGPTVVNADGSVTRYPFDNNLLGRAYGVEVMLRHNMTRHFFGWLAYTLNRSESKLVGEKKYVVTGTDQTHILTAVGSWSLPWGFQIGARFRYVTGRPVTPLVHEYDLYNADRNSFSSTRGPARSVRLRDFQQLDLRIDKSWAFQHWTLTAYLDVQNVYNASNVEATLTDYRFREEIAVPGIPILPILGVRGSF